MERITPPAERVALAEKHRQERAQAPERSARQRLRLRLLRQWGTAYGTRPAASGPVPQRILVIRPDHLGDLLFATPALHRLRQRFPAAHITALLGPWGAPVVANSRDVDQVLTCPFPGFTRQPPAGLLSPYRLLNQMARQLRTQNFDTALVLRFDHWWGAWLAAAAGVTTRVGYDIPETRPFLTQAVAYAAGRHEVAQNLALVQSISGGVTPEEEQWQPGEPPLRFEIAAEVDRRGSELLDGLADRRLVAMHPGSGAAVKRWRTEAWVETASRLADQLQTQIIFTGAADEATLIEPILAAFKGGEPVARPVSLAGQTDLPTLAAIYRRCSLVIGPDSGPLHLAVAMGTPTMHLYGPVDWATFGPWGSAKRHRVVTSDWACVPCNRLDWPASSVQEHGCVRDITVAQVLEVAAELLG